MATGNLFLGSANRSVGDVTFYVRNGKQISRVRRKVISNPRTGIQLARRCILKTVSTAYSILAPICCQSFQGKQSRSMNQARFQKLNLNLLQTRAAAALDGEGLTEAGVYENTTGNFVGKSTMGAAVNPYVISEGVLQFDNYYDLTSDGQFVFYSATPIATMTYQQFIDEFGLQPGDQLTFCVLLSNTLDDGSQLAHSALISDFRYCRVILMPSDGDLSSTLFTASGDHYTINKPNSRNEGSIEFNPDGGTPQDQILITSIGGVKWKRSTDEPITMAAAGIILSRQNNAGWQYSNCWLKLNDYVIAGTKMSETLPLNAAVASFESSQDSSKYLDQARRVG